MAILPKAANTEENSGKMGFSTLPEGEYQMMITKSVMKPTRNKEGKYLQLDMIVTEGEYRGKKYIERLNLVNNNPIAVQIAEDTLNTLCDACGLNGVEDSDDLHEIEFMATVTLQKAKKGDKYGDSNNVRLYYPLENDMPFEDVDED